MSRLILPARFSRQPIPGAPRPRFVRPNALTLDSLSQKLGPYSPSATAIPTVVSLEGVAVKGFVGYQAAWTIPSITIGTGDFTVAISWFNTNVLSASYAYITGSSISYFAVAARHTLIDGNAGLLLPGLVWINTGFSASSAGRHRLVIARRNGTAVWNVDGQRGTAASTTSIPAITGLALSGYDLAGGLGAGSADYPTFYDAYAFELSAWADDEIDQWVENPWALYKDKPRSVYFSAATGGIAPALGGYTYTGNTPAISQPRTVAPSSGAYTYIGNTPAISQPRTIAPAVGSYAYLGSTPEVSQIAGIRPTTGGYVYTGNTPSIGQPRTIAPLEGAYAYAGNTPTVSQSAGVSLSPEDLAAIADAVWADPVAVAAHAKLDAILARLTC